MKIVASSCLRYVVLCLHTLQLLLLQLMVHCTPIMQAHLWNIIIPSLCTHDIITSATSPHKDILRITLFKSEQHLGSWPYPLQSLTIHRSASLIARKDSPVPEEIHHVLYNKIDFIQQADGLMKARLEDASLLKAAFSQAVAEQIQSLPHGPLRQRALIFSHENLFSREHLVHASHRFPSVKKLINMSKNMLDISHDSPWPCISSSGDVSVHEDDNHIVQHDNPSPVLSTFLSCFLSNLAAVEGHCTEHGLEDLQRVDACCGYGIGEYASLVFSGYLQLSDALLVLEEHARAEEHARSLAGTITTSQHHSITQSAIRIALSSVAIKTPRIRVYSGMNSLLYDDASVVLKVFPQSVSAVRIPSMARQEMVELALMQQGVAETIHVHLSLECSSSE